MSEQTRLIAIVGVEKDARVQCQQPGCGHTVYRRIHIVQEAGKLLALGSTCFKKRFGSASALGDATYGSEAGRKLTVEERELLNLNTEELIARFERERNEIEKRPTEAVPQIQVELNTQKNAFEMRVSGSSLKPGLSAGLRKSDTPWPWSRPLSSIAHFTLNDGSKWIRTEHVDRFHMMMPWPIFNGWDECLPKAVGAANLELGGYRINDLILAVAYMQKHGHLIAKGRWSDVMGKHR